MDEKLEKNGETEKLGNKKDGLSLDCLADQAKKKKRNLLPKKDITGYPIQEIRHGRPYYYLIWRKKDIHGKPILKKRYLGTTLPPGYRLGISIIIEPNKLPPETGVDVEANNE